MNNNCHYCGKSGRAIGLYRHRGGSTSTRFTCDNAVCRYMYIDANGIERAGKPRWRVLTSNVGKPYKSKGRLDKRDKERARRALADSQPKLSGEQAAMLLPILAASIGRNITSC